MYVCVCLGITEKNIKDIVSEGTTIEDVQRKCQAGTDCGSCVNSINKLIKENA